MASITTLLHRVIQLNHSIYRFDSIDKFCRQPMDLHVFTCMPIHRMYKVNAVVASNQQNVVVD